MAAARQVEACSPRPRQLGGPHGLASRFAGQVGRDVMILARWHRLACVGDRPLVGVTTSHPRPIAAPHRGFVRLVFLYLWSRRAPAAKGGSLDNVGRVLPAGPIASPSLSGCTYERSGTRPFGTRKQSLNIVASHCGLTWCVVGDNFCFRLCRRLTIWCWEVRHFVDQTCTRAHRDGDLTRIGLPRPALCQAVQQSSTMPLEVGHASRR